MLATGWQSFQDFIAAYAAGLHSVAEVIKILGAFASFYALLKLRNIERRYLFKATIPLLVGNIDLSLAAISEGLKDTELHRTELRKALDQFLADVKTVRRRANGDSVIAAKGILTMMR